MIISLICFAKKIAGHLANNNHLMVYCSKKPRIIFADKDKDDVDSGPDDEEVPTRGYLKRQANLIVDAKSRSKRANRRR